MPPRPPADDVVLVTSWLEPELVDRIRAVDREREVIHEPSLLRPPRYPADHLGRPIERTDEEEARWREHLARATILFDFDATHRDDLPERAPKVRWIQATSAGIGPFVQRMDYAHRMPDTLFTTASGVHAVPLAEFAAMAMLAHARRLLPTLAAQRARRWERFAGTDLVGRTVLVVGLGAIGRAVAERARAFGMRTVGVRRSGGADPAVDAVHPSDALAGLLPGADFLVLAAPHTEATEGMIGAAELAALPEGAVLVNVGRGALVDERALVDALRAGRLAGAWLDVFAEEPLPPDSPLWGTDGVVVSPHSASTSDRENGRIVDLFCDNLRRWREGRPLRNVLDVERGY